jgi:hypothetical protein
MRTTLVAAFAVAIAIPSIAYAQNAGGGAGGAVGGAAVGGAVGGPPGAIIGAGIGAIVGSSLPPEPSVTYEQPIVVGEVLPPDYVYYDVPSEPDYGYIVLNRHKVIVERRTHKIVRVID